MQFVKRGHSGRTGSLTVVVAAVASHCPPGRKVDVHALENQLIALLPRPDRNRLLSATEQVRLQPDEQLGEVGHTARHLWFPTSGVISHMLQIDQRSGLEVAMVGAEGMLGATVILGGNGSVVGGACVQCAGTALRIGMAEFRAQLVNSNSLRRQLGLYLQVLIAQLATAAACQRFHAIAPRVARWLLMGHDRSPVHLHITHQSLAGILGVRRVGITTAALGLQRSGLIGYHRGNVVVLNRAGLEAAACSCYAADQRTYTALMRPRAAAAGSAPEKRSTA